ncbi:hypothetical protein HYC85_005107 [Camellia sinensis]|uniref:Cytochrome C biogenesis protein transmembrane domain-containing protein n=1 Tax=Camellia sinensis TaxID=4442 RepID=A0A7J7HYH0_CAMSI|nr:hypothetical protein HYC85_005107 [Camellia sinensis]
MVAKQSNNFDPRAAAANFPSGVQAYLAGLTFALAVSPCSTAVLATLLGYVAASKVPSLEHNNEIRRESLDLLNYIDSYFEGPALYPDDPTKREFAEELLSYTNTFNLAVITSLKGGSKNEISKIQDVLLLITSNQLSSNLLMGLSSLVSSV